MAVAFADRQAEFKYFIALTLVLVFIVGAVGTIIAYRFRRQKIRLETAFHHMRNALVMFDRGNRLLLVNRRYLEMYRLSPDKVKSGCTVRNLLEQRAAVGTFKGDIDAYIARRCAAWDIEDEIVEIPDGRIFAVSNRRTPNGGFVSIHADVTEEQRAKAALTAARADAERAAQEARTAHQRLRAAIDVIPEGVAIFDAEDRYVLWNKRYAEIYGHYGFEFKVGLRYEDTLRTRVFLGTFPEAIGREEQWLRERLASRR